MNEIRVIFVALMTLGVLGITGGLFVFLLCRQRMHRERIRQRIVRYVHHGVTVSVRADLKGRHRMHCLCYSCDRFKPTDERKQCSIAKATFDNCVKHGTVTPVWECPEYTKK